MNKARETDPKILITGGDAVHPGPAGQALMAASLLKAMRFPKEVASVVVDMTGMDGPKAKNCKIMEFRYEDDRIKIIRLDQALPFFPEKADGILKWTPLLEDMNHYGLTVKGLKAGKYDVLLGGKKVAQYSADDLAKGVNLAEAALKAGPIADQVNTVWKAVQAKTNYFHDQIFSIMRSNPKGPDADEKRKEQYDERMAKMPELDQAIRAALMMRPYEMEIVPAGK
jgi:hypothetical protein